MINKLKNKQGVTMLMALLFLFLAIMVSAVVLAAAVTAAEVKHDDRAQQQAYLNVTSAAKLLETELSDSNFSVGTKRIEKTTGPVEQAYKNLSATSFLNPVIEKLIKTDTKTAAISETYIQSLMMAGPIRFQITAPNMGTVNAGFTIWKSQKSEYPNVYLAQIALVYDDGMHPCTLYMHLKLTGTQLQNYESTNKDTGDKEIISSMVFSWSMDAVNREDKAYEG